MRFLQSIAFLALAAGPMLPIQVAAKPEDAALGRYWNARRDAIIELYRPEAGASVRGRILWQQQNRRDVNNPEPALRERTVVGVDFLKGFRYDREKDSWTGGTVYSPDNGKTYKGRFWLEEAGAALKMRGYWGIPLFGRTESFQRMRPEEGLPPLPEPAPPPDQ